MNSQEKKRVHKRTLKVSKYYVGKVQPYSAELTEESKAKLAELARVDKERAELEGAKNKVESYIYSIKNKLNDNEDEISKISNKKQREELRKLAEDAEEWLYDDGYNADLTTMEAKYAELSEPAEKVWFRLKEMTDRPAAVAALKTKLGKVEELMKKWETTMPQVTEEERSDVLSKVADARKWVEDKEKEQKKKKSHEDPAFSSEDVPLQAKSIEKLVSKLNKKPKPKPEKKEEEKKNDTDADADASDADADAKEDSTEDEAKSAEDSSEESDAEGKAADDDAEL